MSSKKRIQIRVGDQDLSRFQAAARQAGLSLAEWARRQLRAKADEVLSEETRERLEAAERLASLEAPVGPVEAMIEESFKGRYS
jgi:uncharacterized protein (DUF1778 family)